MLTTAQSQASAIELKKNTENSQKKKTINAGQLDALQSVTDARML